MTKKILFGLTLIASLTACTEDYKSWQSPAKVEQPAAITFSDGSVTATGVAINLNTQTEDSVKVVNLSAPSASDAAYKPVYTITLGNTEYQLDANGRMAAADLQEYVAATFGRNPNIERTFDATVNMWVSNGATNVKTATSSAFQIKAYAQAPEIEQRYYVTGSINGWNNSNTDYVLTNDGTDPYTNPTFTCRIPVPADGSNIEFKMTPESGLGGDWSKCLAAGEEAGTFNYDNVGNNLFIEVEEGAKFYDLTFKMLDQTWSYTAVKFNEYIYEIGNETGWSTPHALRSPSFDGKYQGYYFLNGEFKFKPNENDWNGDWGQKPGDAPYGQLVQEGEGNCWLKNGENFYQIDVDLSAMTYALTPVNSISIIGTVNGNWDTDTDLTYNQETGAWEVTTQLNAGAMKFRMNHDWAISWGGANGDPKAYDNLTQYSGKDLDVTEAGTYKIELFITYEGNNKVVITKQ